MAIKGQLHILLIFLFSAALCLSCQSQERKYFIITGKVIAESEDCLNGVVQILKNNKHAVCSEIPDHGRFRLELEYNSEYQLTFNKDGHLSKTIIVNTEIPQEVVLRSNNFPHFLMAVKLFKTNHESGIRYPENQVQQISYSRQYDCFTRIPSVYEAEYVDKETSGTRSNQLQTNKSRMQSFQVF